MPTFASIVPAVFLAAFAASAQAVPLLGTAQAFAVLAHEGVTNAHVPPNLSTQVFGHLGSTPGMSITGFFPDGVVSGGTIHANDAVAQQALVDANQAYAVLASLPVQHDLTGKVLGSPGFEVLTPGVYRFATEAQLNGNLVLDFQGTPNASFVFQIGSTLTTGSASNLSVINAGPQAGVYWQVGSSATLGAGSTFAGNVLAQASVTFDPTAKMLCGRSFALTGAVTLIDNLISADCALQSFGSGRGDGGSLGFSGGTSPVPEPTAFGLMGAGLLMLAAVKRRRLRTPLQ